MPITESQNRNEVKKIKFHHRVKRFYHKNLFRKIYTVAIIGLIGANIFSIMKYASFADESLLDNPTQQDTTGGIVTIGPVGGISEDEEDNSASDNNPGSESMITQEGNSEQNENGVEPGLNLGVNTQDFSSQAPQNDNNVSSGTEGEGSYVRNGQNSQPSSERTLSISDLSLPSEDDDTLRVADVERNTATLTTNDDQDYVLTYDGTSYVIASGDLVGTYRWGFNYNTDNSTWSGSDGLGTYIEDGRMYGNTMRVNNAWGGGGDTASNGYDSGNDRSERQGPCLSGWHVPSRGEWAAIATAWCHLDNDCTESDLTDVDSYGNLYYIYKSGLGTAFKNSFGMSESYYWSSSPLLDNNYYAWNLCVNDYGIFPNYNDYRGNDYRVRCIKAPKTVTLHPNEGRVVEISVIADSEGKVTLPNATRVADLNGERVFEGWFASAGVSEKIGNSGDVITLTANMDVYAHWAQTITIPNPTNPSEGFTILDRNLGATTTGAGSSASTGSYGYYYQWGNNNGNYGDTAYTTDLLTWESDGRYNKKGYDGENNGFIKNKNSKYDIWSDNTLHDDLWGGGSDILGNNRGLNDISTTATDRRGPCPENYHVPSASEWSKIFEYRCKNNTEKCNRSRMKLSNGLYYNNTTENIGIYFAEDLNIPFAGVRSYTDGEVDDMGDDVRLWSSSPYGSNDYMARNLTLSDNAVGANSYSIRALGLPLRCVSDSLLIPQSFILTFDSQGGTEVFAQKKAEGQVRSKPVDPTMTDYVFVDWYTSTGYDTLFDFTAPATVNATAYAKWRYKDCAADQEYDSVNNLCYKLDTTYTVPVYYGVDVDSTHKYNNNPIGTITIKLDEGIYSGQTITMMDMNLGATTVNGAGDYYQWGNNYGFPSGWTQYSNPGNFSKDRAVYQNFGPGYWYEDSKFRWGSSMHDYWQPDRDTNYHNLWGGSGDSQATNWGGINNGETRQGPCPDGYHVPSIGEWNAMITYWYNKKNPSTLKSYTGLNSMNDVNFNKAFLLPRVGHRYYDNLNIRNTSDGYYWSSTPSYDNSAYHVWSYYRNSSNISVYSYYSSRGFGFSVRCFKNSSNAPATYTVEFNANGGTLLGAVGGKLTQKVQGGRLVTMPVGPTKNELVLSGWVYTNDENRVFDFSEPVGGEQTQISLKATYKNPPHTLTLNASTNLGKINNTSTQSVVVEYGDIVDLSGYTATRAGYEFLGWATDSSSHTPISTNYNNYSVPADITLYAIFKKTLTANFVRVDSNAADLSSPISTCTYYNKESACTLTAPTLTAKAGYTVDGWSSINGGTTTTTTFSDGGTYYSVTHNNTPITITFNPNGNQINTQAIGQTGAIIEQECYRYNGSGSCSITSPNIVEINDFEIIGWSTSASKHSSDWTINTPKDVTTNDTYYAQTKKNGYKVTVSYTKGNGVINIGNTSGTCNVEDIYNGTGYQPCTVTTPSITCKAGYKRPLWTPDVVGNTDINVLSDTSYEATCLAADDTRYTVKHWQQNINDDEYTEAEIETKTGTTDTDTQATAKDYQGFTSKSFSQKTIQGDEETVVDIYYDRNEYKVTFYDEDGETVLKAMKKYRYGTKVADMEIPSPTKASTGDYTYIFKGWIPGLGDVSGDVEYKAEYNEVKIVPANSSSHSSSSRRNSRIKIEEDKSDEASSVNETDVTTKGHSAATLETEKYDSRYTSEQNQAYLFAKDNKITTTQTIKEAKMNTPLTRIEMAKMLSQYAMNVLGQTPDASRGIVKFRDVTNKLNAQYDNGVTLAYQLGIMGINMPNNEFRPDDTVTRAEFATALSRMLYDMEDGKGKLKYYEPHMARLYNEGIINNTNPNMKELRGYVMTMLMRTVK